MKEKDCIAQILSGDTEQYRELVERYQTGLIIHCENILKDRQEGEDVAQEAFIKAYRSLPGFDTEKASFSTWLYRIATNLCIDTLRKNKRKVHVKDIEFHLETMLPKHIEQEEIEHIRKLVAELDPPQICRNYQSLFLGRKKLSGTCRYLRHEHWNYRDMDKSCEITTEGEARMRDLNFDALLLAAKPDRYPRDTRFTDAVMQKVKRSEILSSAVRKMDVNKKETFIMRFKHLPRIAIVAIALGTLVIASTGVYAAYQLLWAKPEVRVIESRTSVSGRDEVLLSASGCDTTSSTRYELKKGATIKSDRISAIVQARCELQAIESWAQQSYGDQTMPDLDGLEPSSKPVRQTIVVTSMATHLQTKQGNSLTFAGLDKYGWPENTLKADKNVKYIVDGKNSTADQINEGDVVAYVATGNITMTRNQDGSFDTDNNSDRILVAVIKLSMPFEDYDQFAWQSLSERETCYGNPNDDCIAGGGSIDLYMGGGNAGVSDATIMKEIQGIVVGLDGNKTSIRSSSGTIFTVTTPTDVISDYNTNKAERYYNNQKVMMGSSVSVQYAEDKDVHATEISAAYMRFQIELVSKGDPVRAY